MQKIEPVFVWSFLHFRISCPSKNFGRSKTCDNQRLYVIHFSSSVRFRKSSILFPASREYIWQFDHPNFFWLFYVARILITFTQILSSKYGQKWFVKLNWVFHPQLSLGSKRARFCSQQVKCIWLFEHPNYFNLFFI